MPSRLPPPLRSDPHQESAHQDVGPLDEPLLTSACPIDRREGSWPLASQLVYTTTRSPGQHGGAARVRVGSRLVESFSEFLASRNVMLADRCSAYDKMDTSKPLRCQQLATSGRSSSSSSSTTTNTTTTKRATTNKPQLRLDWNGSSRRRCRSRTGLLLGALLSRRHPAGKLALLLGLLRAPIVLAALFSLALVATLMVLYGLSFAAHHQASGSSWHSTEHPELSGAVSGIQQQQVAGHRISSREAEEVAFNRALTVQTECGSYVGLPDEGAAIVFRAIRYASPPVGPRRWRRPQPVWEDANLCQPNVTWPAPERVAHCAQVSPVTPGRFSGSEDCLYLDIYTPKLGDQVRLLPVMFYIHGGFLAFGSANAHDQVNWLRASPSGRLASELDVVIVAPNYRLQALGFMARERQQQDSRHDNGQLGSSTTWANFGLWDQLGALNWVRRNIEQFAGDPRNIVLFGPDSASALPLALLSAAKPSGSSGGSRGPASSTSQLEQAPDRRLETDQVFRGVWLSNPAVYYQLPVDLARLHYRRIFGSSLESSRKACLGRHQSSVTGEPNSLDDQDYERCLEEASAEQVVRQYLGNDDPGYRLDDQNSMPIHGIFADQFVVSDGELVKDAFPFHSAAKSQSTSSLSDVSLEDTSSAPQTNSTHDRTNSSEPNERLVNGQPGSSSPGPRLQILLGSSAQAVEYWPCPRLLNQWSWTDFRRYVGTSLNSFNTDTYRRATKLYGLDTKIDPGPSEQSEAKLAYLTMVSDIRVTCPTDELAQSLAHQGHQVHRYVVESRPSGASNTQAGSGPLPPPPPSSSSSSSARLGANNKLEFSHHMWDLFAFFGFHQTDHYTASQSDLHFQANLRALVRDFVHDTGNKAGQLERVTPPSETIRNVTKGGPSMKQLEQDSPQVTLFAQDGTIHRQVTGYKVAECSMWRQHLGNGYAWVS